ncbi:hypothetical protein [Pararhodonellum marinum]|uniref:hypothetical protein n=1 Tax=Pararhodonellum marinum TaxID=2755358 RepID=UPI00188F2369|nr:hypothetical protein [Pararhodonellum marinum]
MTPRVKFVLLFLIGFGWLPPTFGQGLFHLELYGGFSNSYLQTTKNPSTGNINPWNPINLQGGVNLLTKISERGFLSAQADFHRRPLGVQITEIGPNFSRESRGGAFQTLSHFSLGYRYIIQKQNYDLYFQPGFGLVKSSLGSGFQDQSDTIPVQNRTFQSLSEWGIVARGEIGVKLYTEKRNYFLLAFKHTQGFTDLDKINFETTDGNEQTFNMTAVSRGTHSGMVVGYGFNLDNLSKKNRETVTRYYSEEKENKRKAALENGLYVIGYAGLRLKSNARPNPDFYTNLSGTFAGALGYKFGGFSLETGYGVMYANNDIQIDFEDVTALIMDRDAYQVNHIPLTLKYDLPIGEKQTKRMGVSLGAHFIVDNTTSRSLVSRFNGSTTINGNRYNYNGIFVSDPNVGFDGVFYKTGLFLELPIFNSSFLNLQVARNFGSPVTGRRFGEYSINGVRRRLLAESSLDGFIFEMAYRLPLKVLKKQP